LGLALPALNSQPTRVLTPENQVQVNLRNFVIGSMLYLDQHDVNSVSYADICGPDKFLKTPLSSIIGEDYNSLALTKDDTIVSISMDDGRTISFQFESYYELCARLQANSQ
ncbi:MAG: hypothetical protein MI922_17540, partial [Bacteroidales bacterium]|nr:hypothetical protein [Bacteroidales bacterium]